MVKDEYGLHQVGDPVGAAAELSQEASALEGGHGLLAVAADLGVGGVVAPLPPFEAAAPKRYSDGSAGALIRFARPAFESRIGQGLDDPVLSRGGQIVSRAGQGRRGPEQSSERIGEDLDVHAVAFGFPGVVRGVGGDAVDRQQGAVEDDECHRPDRLHRLSQGRGEGGQDVDGLAYVAEDRRDPDAGPGRELGAGVTAPQVGESEQGLACDGKAPPPRPDLPPPGGQLSGQEPQGAAGQINRGGVDKHAKLLADTGDLGREPVYQELRRCAGGRPARGQYRQLGKGSLGRVVLPAERTSSLAYWPCQGQYFAPVQLMPSFVVRQVVSLVSFSRRFLGVRDPHARLHDRWLRLALDRSLRYGRGVPPVRSLPLHPLREGRQTPLERLPRLTRTLRRGRCRRAGGP